LKQMVEIFGFRWVIAEESTSVLRNTLKNHEKFK
jgi:hypothetical protein